MLLLSEPVTSTNQCRTLGLYMFRELSEIFYMLDCAAALAITVRGGGWGGQGRGGW